MSEPISTDPLSTTGLALVVGTPERRRQAVAALEARGLSVAEVDDPYTAVAELSRLSSGSSDAGASVLLLSLNGLYREELQIIPAVRRWFPQLQIWLTDLDGRSAALAEAMRLGVDALLEEDGLHRLSNPPTSASHQTPGTVSSLSQQSSTPATSSRNGKTAADSSRQEPRRVTDARLPERKPLTSSTDSAERSANDELDEPYGMSPGEPLLTADELRALLHDPDPAPLGREE